MASLTGQTIADTYKRLLTIDSENFAADASAKYIKDGDAGTASALSLSTTRVGIGTDTPSAQLHLMDGLNAAAHADDENVLPLLRLEPTGTSHSLDFGVHSGGTHAWIQARDWYDYTDTDNLALNPIGGNVGIGTSSPTNQLEVSAVRGSTGGLRISDDADSDNARCYVRLDGSGNGLIELNNVSETEKVQIYTAGVSYFNGGNVGIGTDSPAQLLDINAGAGADCYLQFSENGSGKWFMGNEYNADSFVISNGTEASAELTILTGGNVGIGTTSPAALLELESANLGSNPMLQLKCTEADLDSNEIFMRIDADQDANIHGADIRLITFYDSGGEMGYITTASDGVVNAITASDVRLKKNIKDTTINGLSIINALKIRDYSWNEKAGKARDNLKVTAQYVADEVYEVYPLATTGKPGAMKDILDDDGNKTGEEIDVMGVSDARLISVLIKAVQELSAKVTALENA